MQDPAASRKVQVVYFLSRSGQIEHPHLLEVSVPPNQGLYLRDVKKRLAAIRGNKLPSTYSWSYKRIYRTGYVWQDLCDDDLIFPSNGCEYVLKGSELVTEISSSSSSSEINGNSKEQASVSNRAEPNAKELCHTSAIASASLVESGTDAATQTEEVRKPGARQGRVVENVDEEDDDDEEIEEERRRIDSEAKQLQYNKYRNGVNGGAPPNHQNATELDIKADLPSPPSSSSTNASSPYNKNLGRLVAMEAAAYRYAKSATAEINSTSKSINHKNSTNIRSAASTPGRSNWQKLYNSELERLDHHDATEIAIGANQKLNPILCAGAHSDGELGNVINRNMSVTNNGTAQPVQINANNNKHNSGKSGSKHGGALSLFQFMSCGGLDIKEQIFPMSLYRLRSKSSAAAAHATIGSNDSSTVDETESHSGQFGCEVFGYGGPEGNKSWVKLGCTSKPRLINQQKLTISDDFGVYDVDDLYDNGAAHSRVQQQNQPQHQQQGVLQGDYGVTVSDSMVTDRCLTTSRELGYFSQKSGEIKSSPLKLISGGTSSNRELPSEHRSGLSACAMEASATTIRTRTLSGEIKGSPLFVPGKQYADAGNLISANNYRSKHLSQINHSSTSTDHQSLAQLWDELLTPAREEMENQRCPKSEERTLQNALDMSLPSVELLGVHECPNCNRKVKQELLKSHVKNCSSLKSNHTVY